MKIDRFVSVVAPLYYDADIVEGFVKDIIHVLREHFTNYELVLVDDGSDDDTEARIQELLTRYEGIRYIGLSRSFGEEVAISAGLEIVIGDYVVVMLAHMDPPELVPPMVERSMEGVDVVFGIRRARRREPWIYRTMARLFYWYCDRFLNFELPQNATQFRCLSRQAANAILQIKDSHRYLGLFSCYVGYPRQEFLYDPIRRRGKVKHKSLFNAIRSAMVLIIENSPHPLRLASLIAVLAAIGNLLYLIFILVIYLSNEDIVEGWTTLSTQSAMQFLLIALMLAILSEYIGRILNRLQGRPLYFVRTQQDSNVLLVDRFRPNVVREAGEGGLHQDCTPADALSEIPEHDNGETP